MQLRAATIGFLACFLGVREANAADPLNSNNRPTGSESSVDEGGHNEFNLVPVAGGTTDIGIGGGYFLGLDRVSPGMTPYVWDVESAAFVTFARSQSGAVIVPYQDLYVTLIVPRFLRRMLELEVRPEYSWETTLGYYGLGDASSASLRPGAPEKYFEYGRLHPEIYIQLRWRILDHVIGRTGLRYVQNWIQVAGNSKLEQDLLTGSPKVKALLGSTAPSGVALLSYGIQFDNRDNDVSP
jgi:hypothetical protein